MSGLVTAIILAGGSGSRFGSETPKQYLMVNGRPIFTYCFQVFAEHPMIDSILIAAAKEWEAFIEEWVSKIGPQKFRGFAPPGANRQQSIYNGLRTLKRMNADDNDIVMVHDSPRPLVSPQIVTDALQAMTGDVDGAMPAITVKDTIYYSESGDKIDGLLNRDCLLAGQTPECYRLGKYYDIHAGMSEEELGAIHGSSEIAFQRGMKIRVVRGSERNYKITTEEDLNIFIRDLSKA